jgi:phosphatidylinositol dimannoside acyltransferase
VSLRGLLRNYGAVRPELSRAALLALTVRGVLSYGGYWARLATLPFLTPDRVDRLVRAEGLEEVLAGMRQGRGQVLVLLHQGHWELAGAWTARRLGGVTTVAEVLPRRGPMARLTGRARAAAGLGVVPADAGVAATVRLVRVLRDGGVVALLADRDLADRGVSSRRVPVRFAGVPATLAAGPAQLALATGAQLRPVTVATGGGMARHLVTFGEAVDVPQGPKDGQVAAMTQACADVLGEAVRRHTSDWHLTAPIESRGAAPRRQPSPPAGVHREAAP